jgi:hypothetical protein
MRISSLIVLLLLMATMITGCSSRGTKVGIQAQESNGVRIYIAIDPDPPQAGDNKILVRLVDLASNQPIVDANVTVSAYNELAGGGDRESGRSQGDGEYDVPMKFGIPDSYRLDVEVQRTGQQDSDASFTVTAE